MELCGPGMSCSVGVASALEQLALNVDEGPALPSGSWHCPGSDLSEAQGIVPANIQ